MWKTGHRTLICISGLVWLAIGIFLLTFGISLVIGTLHNLPFEQRFSLVRSFGALCRSNENGVVVLLALALLIGSMKGRFVLSKSAGTQIARILSFSPPVPFSRIYSLGYYLLIALMIGMGMMLRFLPFAQ